ncbi:hypothetical protein J2Z66_006365 [Paenibacillus eucommiae]|uniref:Uncharacterized protein n=1 Tax=Paenibacillus eucommiae TaxID=1355755 RepID=A0ABS4J4I3_9BACL|nr:hypothetical protein [Paenibacillus eucommiae]
MIRADVLIIFSFLAGRNFCFPHRIIISSTFAEVGAQSGRQRLFIFY